MVHQGVVAPDLAPELERQRCPQRHMVEHEHGAGEGKPWQSPLVLQVLCLNVVDVDEEGDLPQADHGVNSAEDRQACLKQVEPMYGSVEVQERHSLDHDEEHNVADSPHGSR